MEAASEGRSLLTVLGEEYMHQYMQELNGMFYVLKQPFDVYIVKSVFIGTTKRRLVFCQFLTICSCTAGVT